MWLEAPALACVLAVSGKNVRLGYRQRRGKTILAALLTDGGRG
jgi:hypothetical protein